MQPVDFSSCGEKNTKRKHQRDGVVREEPDEYYKQLPDEIQQHEPVEYYKRKPDKIAEEEPVEYGKKLERPVEKRISRPPESSSRLHVPAEKEAQGGEGNRSQSIQLDVNKVGLHEFTLDELKSATRNFSKEYLLNPEELYPNIYKGALHGNLMVIITKFNFSFPSDLKYLEMMHHPHLVRLLGSCNQECNILVHEYMPRGGLKHHLLETNLIGSLAWLTRLKIAVGAAKGLAFLHESGEQMMYYSGFTASSILLDSDYTAKLWGFGLKNQPDSMVPARIKSDVYNFGVVLLELLAGRPAVDETRLGPERDLVLWSRPFLLSKDKLHHILDPRLEAQYSPSSVWSTAKVARQCLQSKRKYRAHMRNVVNALEPVLNDDITGKQRSKKTNFLQCFIGSKTGGIGEEEHVEVPKHLADGAVNDKGKTKTMDVAVNEKDKTKTMDGPMNEKGKTKMMEKEPDEYYKQQTANAMDMMEEPDEYGRHADIWNQVVSGR